MPYITVAQAALWRWRDAQERMDQADPYTPPWLAAFDAAEAAKADYDRAVEDAIRTHSRVPEPFEEASAVRPATVPPESTPTI